MHTSTNILSGVIAFNLSKASPTMLMDVLPFVFSDADADLLDELESRGHIDKVDSDHVRRLVDETLRTYDGDALAAITACGGSGAVDRAFNGSVHFEPASDSFIHAATTVVGEFSPLTEPVEDDGLRRYELIREYARGGMGRVMLVYDKRMRRKIAMKEMLAGATSDLVKRFNREAWIAGALEHPGIVPVYEVGVKADGTNYYTMKMVRGQTLLDSIAACATLDDRLKLLPHFVDLCQAIAYAHSRGVIHRDLKPGNVIVGEFGETIVIDWGLAKIQRDHELDSEPNPDLASDDSNDPLTRHGAVMGTPHYMPPEQAQGKTGEVNEQSDIYSLGAILYQILSGKVPYDGKSARQVLLSVGVTPPSPIQGIEPHVPSELIAIAQKAMAADAHARYASAKILADEVQRFLSGAVVESYRYSARERLRLVMRQHPLLSLAAAALILLGTVVAIASSMVFRSAVEVADANRELSKTNEDLRIQTETATVARNDAQAEEAKAKSAQAAAEAATRRANHELYFASIEAARSRIGDGDFSAATSALEAAPPDSRSWEWGHLALLSHRDAGTYPFFTLPDEAAGAPIRSSGYSVDDSLNWLATRAPDRSLWVRELNTGRVLHTFFGEAPTPRAFAAFHPAEKTMLLIDDDRLDLVDLPTGVDTRLPVATQYYAWSAGFTGDGSQIAYRDKIDGMSLWSLDAGETTTTIRGVTFNNVTLHPTGRFAALVQDVTGGEGRLQKLALWDMENRTECWAPEEPILGLAFDGPRLAVLFENGVVVQYDLEKLEVDPAFELDAGAGATAFAVGPDASWHAVSRQDGSILVWKRGEREPTVLSGHAGRVNAIAGRDGLLVSGGDDRSVRIWDVETLQTRNVFYGHSEPVAAVYAGAEGRVASVTANEVKLWQRDTTSGRTAYQGVAAAFLAEPVQGADLVIVTQDGSVRFERPEPDKNSMEAWQVDAATDAAFEFDPSGSLLTVRDKFGLRVYAARDEALILEAPGYNNSRLPVAASPDGRFVAYLRADTMPYELALFDVAARRESARVPIRGSEESFSTDEGKLLFLPATGSLMLVETGSDLRLRDPHDQVSVYGIPSLQLLRDFPLPDLRPQCLAIHPDESVMAMGEGSRVHLIDVATGRVIRSIAERADAVTALAFIDEGRRLVVGRDSGVLEFRDPDGDYDQSRGREVYFVDGLGGPVQFIQLDPRGNALVVGGDKSGVQRLAALPWQDARLPGDATAPVADRLTAYAMRDNLDRTGWGQCQSMMRARLAEALPAFSFGKDPTLATLPCPAGGEITIGEDSVVRCSTHGIVGDTALALDIGAALADAAYSDADRAAAYTILRASLPLNEGVLGDYLQRWVPSAGAYADAALLISKTILNSAPNSYAFLDLVSATANEYKDYATVQQYLLPKAHLHSQLQPRLVYALARDETVDNDASAFEWFETFLSLQKRTGYTDMVVWPALERLSRNVPPDLFARTQALATFPPLPWDALAWAPDLDSALAQAKAEGKLVYADVGSTSATEAQENLALVYSHPLVREFMREHFVACHYDQLPEHPLMPLRSITSVPAALIYNADGDPIDGPWYEILPKSFLRDARRGLADSGRLMNWRIIGPFPLQGAWGFRETFPPEEGIDFDAVYTPAGADGEVRWNECRANPIKGTVYVHHLFEPEITLNAAFYLYTEFDVAEPESIKLDLNYDDEIVVWLNGEKIVVNHHFRPAHEFVAAYKETYGEDATPPKKRTGGFKAGKNTLLIKLVNYDVGGEVLARLEHTNDQPLADVWDVDLPPLPLRRVSPEQYFAAELDHPIIEHADNGVILVDRSLIRDGWRARAADLLIAVQPRLMVDANGNVLGVTGDNISDQPELRRLGLRDGDVIVSVNGLVVDDASDIVALESMFDATEFRVEILRDQAILTQQYVVR